MTANDSEHAGEPSDAVAEFALWLQELRRQAGKPSYAQVVRRSRRRYPHATVRESTISDMLNGKRLPRWETVEPVAWALGGEEAVAACRQRWIEADMARTPPVPLAPPVPPPALEVPSAQEVPQGQAVVEPSRCPDTEPLPAAVPELTGGAPVQAGAAKEPAVLVRRRRWPFVAGGAVVAAAALACVFLLPGNGHRPHPGASATGLATPTRSRTAGQNTAKASLSPSSVPQPA
ncbi:MULTISPECIES: helix-turn-helix domain-containing protein, partial [Streptomyces]